MACLLLLNLKCYASLILSIFRIVLSHPDILVTVNLKAQGARYQGHHLLLADVAIAIQVVDVKAKFCKVLLAALQKHITIHSSLEISLSSSSTLW